MDKMALVIPNGYGTERLTVRAFTPADAGWYFDMSLNNKAHLARYESQNPVMEVNQLADAEKIMADFTAAWEARTAFFMGAFVKGSGEFATQIYVGVVSWDLPEFELGYFADLAHTRQGYTSEAARGAVGWIFNHLQAHRISLGCNDTNTGSIRVAEKCGFVCEGQLREKHRLPDGQITGALLYGLLKREFYGA